MDWHGAGAGRPASHPRRLWLNGDLDLLGEDDDPAHNARYQGRSSVPLTSLPVQPERREQFAAQLASLRGWGINRFSVGWPYRKSIPD